MIYDGLSVSDIDWKSRFFMNWYCSRGSTSLYSQIAVRNIIVNYIFYSIIIVIIRLGRGFTNLKIVHDVPSYTLPFYENV